MNPYVVERLRHVRGARGVDPGAAARRRGRRGLPHRHVRHHQPGNEHCRVPPKVLAIMSLTITERNL